ncbi:MAG: DUF58 domain-containing protein [Rhizobiales bacterium]|nr:DUF58 domain-containing protein [Hyphomicrobiales bacterium]MBI3673926.1 DUF58 domain-containing protein [Hyphomicrobiales bacterium]
MTTTSAFILNDAAARASGALPPLLVEAERVAATVILGIHGRKRAGPGENFWQYRPYSFGDSVTRVDWHKSARSDRVFIRENEWEAANTLWLWASPAPSMNYSSHLSQVSKRDRANLLALALASLALRAHERVGLIGAPEAPGYSRAILLKLAERLIGAAGPPLPAPSRPPRLAGAVLIGDFFETPEALAAAFAPLAEARVAGHLVQVTDPAEETLPWSGRVEFREIGGPRQFLAGKAEALREAYGERLAAHRDALRQLAARLGWTFTLHRTDASPVSCLLALHGLLGGVRALRLSGGAA